MLEDKRQTICQHGTYKMVWHDPGDDTVLKVSFDPCLEREATIMDRHPDLFVPVLDWGCLGGTLRWMVQQRWPSIQNADRTKHDAYQCFFGCSDISGVSNLSKIGRALTSGRLRDRAEDIIGLVDAYDDIHLYEILSPSNLGQCPDRTGDIRPFDM
jgi:hypothetical protein